MKHLFLSLVLILFTTTASLGKEFEGDDAKNIVMNGEVLGMTLFDDLIKDAFDEEEIGYIFSVKNNNKLYYCYNFNRFKDWFCDGT